MIILGTPTYDGKMHIGTHKAALQATSGKYGQVNFNCNAVSLLAMNFNQLWAGALNAVHKGHDVKYFAMLHADCEPIQKWWLDLLIDELEARELDVLGCVVPIKDQKGLTSIAIERKDADPFSPQCRLTMTDVFNLPETFTAEDVGYDLLLNTGCWVAKWDQDWCSQVYFTINDRIHFDEKKDQYEVAVEPEDWNFARQLNRLGRKIAATRKVHIRHHGSIIYSSEKPWGQYAYDRDFLDTSLIQPPGPEGFRFPYDVDGWLLPAEGGALASLAEGKRVLEIGSYEGKSTICMAQTADYVVSIDPHTGAGTPEPRETFDKFRQNVSRYGVADKVEAHHDRDFVAEPFDLVFIDGAHDLMSVKQDIAYACSMVKPGGLIAFHDYRREPGEHDGRWDPDVTQAVNEFVAQGAELVDQHATVAVVRPPQLTMQGAN